MPPSASCTGVASTGNAIGMEAKVEAEAARGIPSGTGIAGAEGSGRRPQGRWSGGARDMELRAQGGGAVDRAAEALAGPVMAALRREYPASVFR